MRIGQSIDIHPLKKGRKLILGGVEIKHEFGLDGHSDADVLAHAVAESLLGALALGDLGKHFPDIDPKYKGANSILLLEECMKMVNDKGYVLGNMDATILAEKPKMAPYILQMRENLAKAMDTDIDNVSVKATRGEKMGFVGRQEGIAVIACCLLEKKK